MVMLHSVDKQDALTFNYNIVSSPDPELEIDAT